MKLIKYEVRGTLVDVTRSLEDEGAWPPSKNVIFGTCIALDPEDALRAAIEMARRAETIGSRMEDFYSENVRIVKITEEEVQK